MGIDWDRVRERVPEHPCARVDASAAALCNGSLPLLVGWCSLFTVVAVAVKCDGPAAGGFFLCGGLKQDPGTAVAVCATFGAFSLALWLLVVTGAWAADRHECAAASVTNVGILSIVFLAVGLPLLVVNEVSFGYVGSMETTWERGQSAVTSTAPGRLCHDLRHDGQRS